MRGLAASLHASPGCARISLSTARDEAGDGGTIGLADFTGDALDRSQVIRRCGWETRFDDVYAQASKLAGNLELFRAGQGRAWALLAIAQGCIEDDDGVIVVSSL